MFSPRINYELLPIKASIFLYSAAQACHLNYWAISGRQAGLDPVQIGYIFGVAPLAAVALKPVAGFIADRTRSISGVLIGAQLLLFISTWAVFLSPVLHASDMKSCASGIQQLDDMNQTTLSSKITVWCLEHCASKQNLTKNLYDLDQCRRRCELEEGNCIAEARKSRPSTIALFSVFLVTAYALTATIYSLLDTATYETLGSSRAHLFGRQRLWGTLGWGALSPFIGLLVDAAAPWIPYGTNFLPAVALFSALISTSIVVLCIGPRFETPVVSDHFFKDLKTALENIRVVVFIFWAFMSGVIIGVLWTYSVWRLEDLKGSKALIGLTFAVQSLVIEVPIFFLAGSFIKRLGFFGCVTASFLCAATKLFGYALMQDARLALLIDVVGGATFPLFYAALTAFASVTAIQGTSATMQCVFGAVFEGAGVAMGNYVCGQLIGHYSIQTAFKIMGTVALVSAVFCAVTGFIPQRPKQKDEETTCQPAISLSTIVSESARNEAEALH